MIDVGVKMLSAPQVARRYAVKSATVIGWIRAGELAAIDVAKRGSKRPRFRVDPADLIAFDNRRAVVSTPRNGHGRRRSKQTDTIEFF